MKRHIVNEYVNKRKRHENLDAALAVLNVIKDNGNTQPLQNITTFKKKLKVYQYFNQKPLGSDEYNVRCNYFLQDSRTGNLYGYETASRGVHWGELAKRVYLVNPILLEEQNQNVENQAIRSLLQRVAEWIQIMGFKFMQDQIDKDQDLYRTLEKLHDEHPEMASGLLNGPFESAGVAFEIVWAKKSDDDNDFEPFGQRRLRDSTIEKYIANKYVAFDIDEEAESWNYLIDTKKKYSDYVTETYDNLHHSCMAKLIIHTYKKNFDWYKSVKCGNSKVQLDMAYLHKICFGYEWDEKSEVVMTLDNSIAFFKLHRLGIEVYDIQNNLIQSWYPPRYHQNIKPAILRILYHDNHVEEIQEMRSFERRVEKKVTLSKNFYIPKGSFLDDKTFILAHNASECLEIIKKSNSNTYIVYNDNLNQLLIDTILPSGLTPKVSVQSGATVNRIYFPNLKKKNSFEINIVNPCKVHGFTDIRVKSIEDYKEYVKTEEYLRNSLINNKNLSHFELKVATMFNEYGVNIPFGSVNEASGDADMVDCCKQYASCAMNAPYIPIVSPFEEFEHFAKGDIVQPDFLYVIEVLERSIIFPKNYTLIFGFNLLEVEFKYKVLQKLRLITRPNDKISAFIKELFEGDTFKSMDAVIKKSIPNKIIGLCGKKYNKQCDSMIFKNEDDAIMYLVKHGGVKSQLGNNVWIVNKYQNQEIENGFRPVREMILCMARHQMYKLYRSFKDDGLHIIGCKTDALYFEKNVNGPYQYEQWLTGKLGGLKLDHGIVPPKQVAFVDKPRPQYGWVFEPMYDTDNPDLLDGLEPFDDNDTKKMESLIVDETIVLSLAGRGKTHLALSSVIKKHGINHVLVVTPYNSQSHNVKSKYGVQAITYHHFRGEGLDGSRGRAAFDLKKNNITCVVFDEIMLFDHRQLVNIWKWKRDRKNIAMVATGDPYQLEAIGDIVSNDLKAKYVIKLFPRNVVRLKTNRRLKTEQDRKKMEEAENDLFVGMPYKEWVNKHFKKIKTLDELKKKGIKRAVAYFNNSNAKLNETIHSEVQYNTESMGHNGQKLFKGMTLICKEKIKMESGTLHRNYTYKIKGFATDTVIVTDILTEEDHEIKVSSMSKFSFPYSNTVHSSQGASISEPFVIADWKSFGVTKNWLYTAISRASSFDDIYFLDEQLYSCSIDQMIRNMIAGYKRQDQKRGTIGGEYIDSKWIKSRYQKCSRCRCCGETMVFETGKKNKVTVNRIDNSLGHVKGNCELLCKICNVSVK